MDLPVDTIIENIGAWYSEEDISVVTAALQIPAVLAAVGKHLSTGDNPWAIKTTIIQALLKEHKALLEKHSQVVTSLLKERKLLLELLDVEMK